MHISYPENLPVTAHRHEIIKAIVENQVIIVAGDTGSGKTTQLPKFCIEALNDPDCRIGCTQPRRIAAISVANRVAEELGDNGYLVGSKIRFQDRTTATTRIKFMTDGILLAETANDPKLKKYQVIIVDEAHERSLNIDFIIGYLKNLLPARPDLKIIITSATIDTLAFSKHFDEAPIIEISGRTFPVDIDYQPCNDENENDSGNYLEHCVNTVATLNNDLIRGDTLVFLPTEKDIRICCEQLSKRISNAVILPLFGRLATGDQKRIFASHKKTKIVVATNIAETSITVPGIRYVVDTGLARISSYNVQAKTTSLPVAKISRAACEQRAGRCGRIGPGICIRLFSEEDFQNRPEYTLPEIKRSNLAEVILQMTSLGLGSLTDFPFLDPPHRNAVTDGYRLLTELGGIDKNRRLTPNGKIMARLPMDPCIARIILEAKKNGCLTEIKIIASALAIQDPRIRPGGKEQAADLAHKTFAHDKSDFLSLLKIWQLFHSVKGQVTSWGRLKKFCKGHYLSFQRMREWLDLHEQLSSILDRQQGFSDNQQEASYNAIHCSLTSGFLRNIALKKKGNMYTGGGGKELSIFPGSHQFQKGGKWIIGATFLHTSRLYALTVATIEPEWLEEIGKQSCKYSWSSPRWQKKSGQVIADEKVSLFGLPLVAERMINYGRINRKTAREAREIFIHAALIEGNISGNIFFLRKNQTLLKEWQDKEERLRKRDLLVDDLVLYEFYDQRIPADVYDRFTLNRFLRRNRDQKFLLLTEKDIVNRSPEKNKLAEFPATITVQSHTFQLEYHFEPGKEQDGVTVRIPVDLAPHISVHSFDWLVPGLLPEKTITLLKALPKRLRRNLVPLNDTVDLLLDDLKPGTTNLYQALERSITKLFNTRIIRSDWSTTLPPHLTMRFLIFDNLGQTMATGRNLAELIRNTAGKTTKPKNNAVVDSSAEIEKKWDNRLIVAGDLDLFPHQTPILTPTNETAGYLYAILDPAPEQAGTRLHFTRDLAKARQGNRLAINCLYRLEFPDQYKSLKKYCNSNCANLGTFASSKKGKTKGKPGDLILSCLLAQIFNSTNGILPDKREFFSQVETIKQAGLYQQGKKMADSLFAAIKQKQQTKKKLEHYATLSRQSKSFDQKQFKKYQQQLDSFLPVDFLTSPQFTRLNDCLRYFRALEIRMERAHVSPDKDHKKDTQIQPFEQHVTQILERQDEISEDCQIELGNYIRLLNEFRIALFAPEVKTSEKISAKKMNKAWLELQALC